MNATATSWERIDPHIKRVHASMTRIARLSRMQDLELAKMLRGMRALRFDPYSPQADLLDEVIYRLEGRKGPA
jgi:hypothetical protein